MHAWTFTMVADIMVPERFVHEQQIMYERPM